VKKIYPGLSHVFAPVLHGTIADYSDPHAKMDAGFLDDVAAWLAKAL
jgi:hypothetical protein